MAAAGAEHNVLYERGDNADSDAWDDSVLIKAYDDAVLAVKTQIAEQYPEYAPKMATSKKKKRKNKGKLKSQVKKTGLPVRKWAVGDLCEAVYTEDGETYSAKILSIDKQRGTCNVVYTDYGNTEEQELSALLLAADLCQPPSSQEQLTDTASEAESVACKPSVPQEKYNVSNKPKAKPSQQSQKQRQKLPFPTWPPQPTNPLGQMPPPPPPPQTFPHFQASGYQAAGPSMPPPPIFPTIPPPPPWYTEGSTEGENEALYSMLISWYMSGYHTGYYQGLKHGSS